MHIVGDSATIWITTIILAFYCGRDKGKPKGRSLNWEAWQEGKGRSQGLVGWKRFLYACLGV
jgi:hypothetical protein